MSGKSEFPWRLGKIEGLVDPKRAQTPHVFGAPQVRKGVDALLSVSHLNRTKAWRGNCLLFFEECLVNPSKS